MIVKALLITNWEKVQQAEKLALKVPEKEFVWIPLSLRLDQIDSAYISPREDRKGNIVASLPSGTWVIEFNQELWNMICTTMAFYDQKALATGYTMTIERE